MCIRDSIDTVDREREMAQDSQFAIAVPNTMLYGQTFMKRREGNVSGEGEYTYTSELNKMRQQ